VVFIVVKIGSITTLVFRIQPAVYKLQSTILNKRERALTDIQKLSRTEVRILHSVVSINSINIFFLTVFSN
jgi:hypothetical protein